MENPDKSAFVIAYCAVADSGYLMDMLTGWMVWG